MNVISRFNYLIVIIFVSALLFIAAGILLLVNTEQTIAKSKASNLRAIRTSHIDSDIQKMITTTIVLESKVRGLVLTGDEAFINGVQDSMFSLKKNLEQLHKDVSVEVRHPLLPLLTTLVDRKIKFTDETVAAYFRSGMPAAQQLVATKKGTLLRDSIIDITIQIDRDLQHQLSANLQQNIGRSESVLWLSRILTVLAIGGVLALSYLVVRRLRKQQSLILLLQLANNNEAAARRKVEKISADIEDLYNHAPCGYHSLNKEGFFSAINQTELNWLGYKHSEVIGKLHFTDVVDKQSAQLFRENFDNFKDIGTIQDLRFNMVTKSGRSFPVSLNSTAIYDIKGNYLSSRSTVFDITSQVQIEAELKEAKRMADQSAQIKEQFLANMSHEIRTPVNSMIGFTNLLQKTTLAEDQRQFVNLIQSASENLLVIINEILDISKIEAGMLRIEIHPFSLQGLCNSIETMFRHRAQDKNLSFSISVQEDIPDTLNGDPVRLTQILVNLIANAIKFTAEGNIDVQISMLNKTEEKVRLLFSVRDTGIGIPQEKLGRIFERFEQGETDTTRKYGGTGLGLAIVKKLVEIQDGEISVISEQAKGTEFQLELEYGLIANGNHTHITYDREIGTPDPLLLKGIRILIVEDNEMNQLLMKHTFQSWQMAFEIAGNGQHAIEWLQRDNFDLVLLDIQMPVMDGYATAQGIRKDLKSHIPIIAMTAHAMPGEREKCLSHGMNDYISKPLHERELQLLLKKYLQKKGESVEALKAELRYVDMIFFWDLVMENAEFMHNVLRQFMKQFPGEMESLKEAVAVGDTKRVAGLAHHIQSTVSVLGKKTPFFDQLENLEKTALNRGTSQQLNTAFNSLYDHKQLLLREIDRLMKAEFE